MRVDLISSPYRPWPLRLLLALARKKVGGDLAPPTVMSWRPQLLHRGFVGVMARSAHGDATWDKGTLELLSAFISQQNTCHF